MLVRWIAFLIFLMITRVLTRSFSGCSGMLVVGEQALLLAKGNKRCFTLVKSEK